VQGFWDGQGIFTYLNLFEDGVIRSLRLEDSIYGYNAQVVNGPYFGCPNKDCGIYGSWGRAASVPEPTSLPLFLAPALLALGLRRFARS
jgi:hypothetical protein